MFKFIKQYTETMTGAAFYPIFSLLIFFIFFVVLLIYVQKMDKARVQELKSIPLGDIKENVDPVL